MRRCFLRAVRDPALIDQIGMDIGDVLVAQDIVEALHARRRERAAQHDVLEGRVQSRIEPAQIGCDAGAERMAAGTLFDEFDFSGIDLGRGGGLRRRFGKRFVDPRRRSRHVGAAMM